MTTYRVHLAGVVSTSVTVEVDPSDLEDGSTPQEVALEKAYAEHRATLCFHCSRHMEEPGSWHAGDWIMGPEDLEQNVEEVK